MPLLCLALAAAACRSHDPEPLFERRRVEVFGPPGQPGDALPGPGELYRFRDLDDALRHGLLHNAELRAAFETWQAEVEAIGHAGTLPDPRVSFAYFVEEIQTRTGPQESRLSLMQTLPWFGTLEGQRELQSHRAHEAWHRVRAIQQDLERKIRVEYFEYAFMGKQIELQRDEQRLLEQLRAIADQRFTSGSGSREDLLRLNVEIGLLEDGVRSLEERRPAMSARLSALLNLSASGLFEFPELPVPGSLLLDPEELRGAAERRNPGVLELRERIQQASVRGEQATRDGYPDLTLGLDYFSTSPASTPVRGSGDDPVAVTVGLSLPIWRSSIAAGEREADRRLNAARLALIDELSHLRAGVEWEVYQVNDAARRVVLYRDTLIPQMQEALEVLRTSYSAGTAPVEDFLEAERILLNLEVSYWRACKETWQGEARLIALCGGELTP